MTNDLDRIVTAIAPDPGPGTVPGARDLMNEIMDTEPTPLLTPVHRRSRSLRIALPAIALLAATVTVLSWTSGLPGFNPEPVAALDIEQKDGYYLVQVKDIHADPENYEAQLEAVGLDISLRVIPATPGLVGMVLPTDGGPVVDQIKTIDRPGSCDKAGGCPIGIKIPVGFTGSASISLGREARPGEEYQSITSISALGEPLHCVPHLNKTVAEVRALLKERGISIQEFTVDDPRRTDPLDGEVISSVPDSWYVTGGSLLMPGKATIDVFSSPMPSDQVENVRKATGCPTL
ncbi:hypothetical protein [Nonomuraea glycinis]|uniref:hypothetical protein n=1 Tax=Nonomuraea glycinis TaxID=2047744 RepID=UPI002E117B7F|nr:hypothetical protein OHA68_14460 [Nonomuraea glycinis]